MPQATDLNDNQAIAAMQLVAQSWLKSDGVAAFNVMADAREYERTKSLDIPGWANGMPPSDSTERGQVAQYCRAALTTLLDSDDNQARGWAQSAIQKVTAPQGHVLETVLLVKGAIMVAMILAARVKKIDSQGVEFYQGMPEGLSKMLSAAGSFFGK